MVGPSSSVRYSFYDLFVLVEKLPGISCYIFSPIFPFASVESLCYKLNVTFRIILFAPITQLPSVNCNEKLRERNVVYKLQHEILLVTRNGHGHILSSTTGQ